MGVPLSMSNNAFYYSLGFKTKNLLAPICLNKRKSLPCLRRVAFSFNLSDDLSQLNLIYYF